MKPNSGHDDSPDSFPEIWNAQELLFDYDLNKVINKHVWLALSEYVNDVWVHINLPEGGEPSIKVHLGETEMSQEIPLRAIFARMDEYFEKADYETLACILKDALAKTERLITERPARE